ncbi:MAG: S26 family signal peptidase, partial [Anaerolineaceae bacterium]
MSMSTSQQETAASLKSMVLAAAPATVCPPNMAETVLSRRRRRRTRRALFGAGAATLAGGVLAASTLLGQNPYFSQIQPSGAMEPAIGVLDLVVLNRDLVPTRGDVILVTLTGSGEDFEAFSRVMALPGDTIGCPEDETGSCPAVEVNGEPISDAYLASLDTKPFPTETVLRGQMFLLGDNRRAAVDSRS